MNQIKAVLRILCIAHSDFDLSAHIVSWIEDQNYTLSYCRPFQGEILPSIDDFDWLILTGGTQCLLEKDRYPFLLDEIHFVEKSIVNNKLVLGFCLGAQIIGESYGQKTELSPYQEIGVFPIELTMDAKDDPVLQTLPPSFNVAHWHKYMPGITQTAKVLATSKGCPRQIIRYSPRTYAFQCHPEVSFESVQRAISLLQEELPKEGLYIQKKEDFLNSDFSSMKNIFVLILNRIAKLTNNIVGTISDTY